MMLEEFIIPKSDPSRGGLREADANSGCRTDVLDDLKESDALYITEDDNYERCEELARRFTRLDARQRAATVDVFAANLSLISTSAKSLLSDQESALPAATIRHRNGIKMLVYLLHSIATQAAKDTQALKGAENAAKAKPAGKGRKAVVMDTEDDSNWNWEHGKQRVLSAVGDLITLVDLKALFKGLAAAQQLINMCMELALQGLEAPNIAKQESNWVSCRNLLVRGAVQYQQSEFIAHALMELVRKHDHMPQLAALLAKYAEEHYNNTQLAVMLLTEFSAVAPEDYDAQYATNQVSVRLAGDLVAALAELMPKVVSNQTSQLQPYLGCSKAYCLRGALLQAVGSMLAQVYRSDNLSSSLGAGAAAAHLRSKDTLLALLHARILDKVSFVRQKVLQTWGRLVEESCVPISHWNLLLQEAIGRLEDDSQLVVKAALQLLHRMVAQGLFQPPLKTHIYINTLHQAEAELAKLQPAQAAGDNADEEGEAEQDDEAAGDDDAGADGARWEYGDIHIKEEPTEQPGTAEQAEAAGVQMEGAKPSNDGAVQRIRTMVASLKEGVSFCKRLAATLPQLQVLLANPAANVVHDAIVFLTLCKTFEVTGAAKALRGMWPLVFSKHEPVRGAVLDSWHILHLHDKLPKQQMEELVMNVVPTCSLSELTALESIIASLVQQDKLSAVSLVKQLMVYAVGCTQQLRQLPAAAGTRDASDEASMDVDKNNTSNSASVAEQTAALQSTVRHAFTLLSMLTAAQPTALAASYLPVLLEVGLATDLLDAWVARHTCLALKYAAPQLTGSTAAAPNTTTTTSSSSTPMSPETHQSVLASLVRLLVATPSAAVAPNWPSAAEAAVAAVYALSPKPQELMAAALADMLRRSAPGGGDSDRTIYSYSAASLSRFFFVLGRTSLQHLLCIEQTSKAIRAARLAADRAAAEAIERQMMAAAAGSGTSGARKGKAAATAQPAPEDIGAQLGVGSVAADAELDALAEMVEAQILSHDELLGTYGQLLSKFLHLKSTLAAPQELQECALLALTQLMAVDSTFCADNLRLLFTLLLQRHVSAPRTRVNMVVALADLASRFPNLLEPWTAEIYLTLADPDPAVKLSALTSLTHLVLGGMVKAKGRNVAQVAVLLVDDVQDLKDRAVLFFESLAKTGSGNARSASAAAGASAANPVYNLLPDCLSTLLTMKELRQEQLQVIMGHLLAYVKDKQAESLRERLVARLQVGGPREWRLVAWCIEQLGYSEKGLRRIIEMTASYRHALGEQQVFDVFATMADKARRSAGGNKAAAADEAVSGAPAAPGDLRPAVDEWVADLTASRAAALEAAEVEAMEAARKQRHQQQQQEKAPGEERQQEEDMTMASANEDAEQQQEQQQQQRTDAGTTSEPMAQDNRDPSNDAALDGVSMPELDAAAAGLATTGAAVAADEPEQIELLQSQVAGDDDADADDLVQQTSAEAAALRKQMERLSMAPTPARAARQTQRHSTATSIRKPAGAATKRGGSRAAARTNPNTKKAVDSSAESSDAGDSSSSDFEEERPAAPAVSRSRAGRACSSTAGRTAGGTTRANSHKQASQQLQRQMHDSDESSSDDDD